MLKPTALVAGHYECRSLKQSLPILQDLLALEVIMENNNETVLKHPNTGWKLIAHESSPDAPDKPFQHHYGVRVATNQEIDGAHEYLQSKKREYKIKIIPPKENHNAYSVHFLNREETSGKSSLMKKPIKPVWARRRALTGKLPSARRNFPGGVTFLRH